MINLRSDTQTLPTAEMLDAMRNAPLGDDVFGEDPTVNRLEQLSAEILGKEEALFVASGTMGNLCALMSHTRPGDEVILEGDSHTYYYEVGGFSALAGLSPRMIPGLNGIINVDQIKQSLRPKDLHFPPTTLLCLENSHNRGGGTVYPVQLIDEICQFAHEGGLKVHIDGARIFNAAVSLKVDVKELVKNADSVMFCLSKGLSAPVGSMLAGSSNFIKRARKNRKMLGGGMRQAGVLAAAGIIAIEKMVERLADDHTNARFLAEELNKLDGLKIDLDTVQTNMIYCDISQLKVQVTTFLEILKDKGILVSPVPPSRIRLVTNRHISREDINKTIEAFKQVIAENW
ncbi:MAG: low-specificity L-threonine aldolase [Atribacterota bacterium]|nr:low-specificity L-threonine aldolase [Atribacterota bacterium]MDD3031440.1 low-specificity L-threonine aldolase [Atribacterota bacterium]MDD3641354.1 low-specificity L-threonine aldolase [Atribacterota bacterium]MDD4289032.1 low-specificity L-threonine aldolase [Atribacterota bacterium]MDD4765570.1 low-specificity L-threonine aldolase [Atribacterota bacterium]